MFSTINALCRSLLLPVAVAYALCKHWMFGEYAFILLFYRYFSFCWLLFSWFSQSVFLPAFAFVSHYCCFVCVCFGCSRASESVFVCLNAWAGVCWSSFVSCFYFDFSFAFVQRVSALSALQLFLLLALDVVLGWQRCQLICQPNSHVFVSATSRFRQESSVLFVEALSGIVFLLLL